MPFPCYERVLLWSPMSIDSKVVIYPFVGAVLMLAGLLLAPITNVTDSMLQAASDLVYIFLGLAILLAAITISILMGIVAWRLYKLPSTATMGDWQPGLTTGILALFSTLVAGVFVITTFRIDKGFGGETVNMQELLEGLSQSVPQGLNQAISQDSTRSDAELGASGQGTDTLPITAFQGATDIDLGSVERLSLTAGGRATVRLEVLGEGGIYRIEVRAGSDSFDPIVSLYETLSGTTNVTLVELNKDIEASRDSSMQRNLDVGEYYIDIEGREGRAGECTLLVQKLN